MKAPWARKAAAKLLAFLMTSPELRGSVSILAMPFCRSMTTKAVFVGSNPDFAMSQDSKLLRESCGIE
jgi:hypothetical protein